MSPELVAALATARKWFDSLLPEEQEEHLRAQRRNWVRAELSWHNPKLTDKELDAYVDAAIAAYDPPRARRLAEAHAWVLAHHEDTFKRLAK